MDTTKLKPCPDCGRELSGTAIACPQCGRVMQKEQTGTGVLKKFFIWVFIFSLLAVLVWMLLSGPDDSRIDDDLKFHRMQLQGMKAQWWN